VDSSCDCRNEPSGSVKCWKVLEYAANPVAARVALSSIDLVVLLQEIRRIYTMPNFTTEQCR
jgi:hypothetical protein